MRWLAVVAFAGCGRLAFDPSQVPATDGATTNDDATTAPQFFDDFNRPDNAAIGNGWIEQAPATFEIVNNQVARVPNGDWTINQVYRPASEDALNIEVSLEFTITDTTIPDWPQVFVRGTPADFAGYYIWIEDGPSAAGGQTIDIARKAVPESWWTGLMSSTVPGATVGERYRLRLRASGANPVSVDGFYEQFSDGNWVELVALHGEDLDPNAITGAGTWGFDGHVGTALGPYVYDNFAARY